MSGGGVTPELHERICAVLDELGGHDDDAIASAAREGLTELQAPLRVAVAGRLKAGKSTLVNALVGRRVAYTAPTEATRVVTTYEYGMPDRAYVVLGDDTRRPIALTEHGTPDNDALAEPGVLAAEVYVQSSKLKSFSLIDTPGLEALTPGRAAATRAHLIDDEERRLVARADAVLYVFSELARTDDIAFLRAWQETANEFGPRAAIGIVGRADIHGAGPFGRDDPLEQADVVARELFDTHHALVDRVIAVSGLLGEAARVGAISGAMERTLRALAELTPTERRVVVQAPATAARHGVDEDALDRLMTVMGQYAVARSADVVEFDEGVTSWAATTSRVPELEHLLSVRLSRRAALLKANATLGRLHATARGRRRPDVVDALQRLHLDPLAHPLREHRVYADLLARGHRRTDTAAMLERLFLARDRRSFLDGATDAERHRDALRRSAAAQTASNEAYDLTISDAERVLARSWMLVAQSIM